MNISENFQTYLLLFSGVLPLLYAETHYKFKYFFSRLNKNEPEIIADMPSRITKGDMLPVLVIIKDADRFPVDIISVSVSSKNRVLFNKQYDLSFSAPYKEILFEFKSVMLPVGLNEINVLIKYNINGEIRHCVSDNHKHSSHKPFPVYISENPLPKIDDCYFGEMHCHTIYTSDQVEFGASILSTAKLAGALGLDFYCATDHSYDMDDMQENYLINDPELRKWTAFKKEVQQFNEDHRNFVIIPGEEVTLRNSKGKNVHCLIYNSEKFYPGSGDSAEKWFRTRSEMSITELAQCITEKVLMFAAHPAENPPFTQRLFIKRDIWREKDCIHPRLTGLQFVNGGFNDADKNGIELWSSLLLKGYNLVGICGNDAHGNFARFRQIGIPFISMREYYKHLFGKWRTGVYLKNKKADVDSIILALKEGNCFLTDGPALNFQALAKDKWFPMGSKVEKPSLLKIELKSTSEFSSLKNICIFAGIYEYGEEIKVFEKKMDSEVFEFASELNMPELSGMGYLRLEAVTQNNSTALSNPIWFNI